MLYKRYWVTRSSFYCIEKILYYVLSTKMSLLFISGCYGYRSTKKLFVQSSWKLNSDVLTSLLERTTPTQLPRSNGLIIWSSVKPPQLFKKGKINNQNVWNGVEASFCLKYSSVKTKFTIWVHSCYSTKARGALFDYVISCTTAYHT